ncbi:hypothetical protein AAVH_13420 [Aphelenchoides avenae]|nr:hypothetical protein AAVH_13420 [Aphelenchus avenae]
MSNGGRRQQYVLDHWIWTGSKKIPPSGAAAFAATFTMDNLLLFDFIADNADWIAANAICMELFKNWQDESRPSRSSNTRISTDIPMNRLGL